MLYKTYEKVFKQKSQVKWLHLGDKNIAFFHKTVTQIFTQNHIYFFIYHNDLKIVSTSGMKEHATTYFQSIFVPRSPWSTQFLEEFCIFGAMYLRLRIYKSQ